MEKLTETEGKIKVYVDDAMRVSIAMKGHALMNDNMHAYASAQGAIDILLDLQGLLAGGDITSLAEVQKKIKEAEAKKEQGTDYIT